MSGAAEPRRLHRRRVAAPHVVMVVAGALGLVLTLAALRTDGHEHQVLVAARDLPAGTVIERRDVRLADVSAAADVLDRMVGGDDADVLRGRVVTAAMRAGDPFLGSQVRVRSTADGRRAMSIPIERARAVNGALAPGDRVDVVVAGDAVVTIVAPSLEVLAVDDPDGGALGSRRSDITVTLAVDAGESLLLADALADGDFVLTRVTGAASADGTPPLPRERSTR